MTDSTPQPTDCLESAQDEPLKTPETTPTPAINTTDTQQSTTIPAQEPERALPAQNAPTTNVTPPGPGKLSQPVPQLTPEQQLQKLRRDLESMVLKYAKSEQENLKNQHKVDELDKKLKRALKDNEQLANRIKLVTNDKNHLTDTLNAKLAQLTVLEQKNCTLTNEQSTLLKDYESQIKQLKDEKEELTRQVESHKGSESELLDMSERLSMRHMLLQSELEDALNKAPELKEQYETALQEREQLVRQREEMTEQVERLTDNLDKERQRNESLKLELELQAANYQKRFDEFDNELKMLKRKHQVAIKVLTKELKQQCAVASKIELA